MTGSWLSRIEEKVKFHCEAVRNVRGAANEVSGPPNRESPESLAFFRTQSLRGFSTITYFSDFL
jgi:hypothetical protein